MSLFIIDGSVVCKLFLDEPGRDKSIDLIRQAAEGHIQLIAPDILPYEALSAAHYYRLPLPPVLDLLETQWNKTITLISPTPAHWKKAIEIANTGSPKSGYPAIYDAVYHALAITEKGTFITADKKHYEKTKSLGSIQLFN